MNADLRFPIGKFVRPESFGEAGRAVWIDQIAAAPAALRAAVAGLDDAQLETPYREGGWTVRQLVHHLPDSHMNAYVRFRLALTEHEPTIKPYEEQLWADLPDGRSAPVAVSLDLLDRLHERWLLLLRALGEADYRRSLVHPVNGRMSLNVLLALYAWHGRHHVAHITALREREGWG